MMGAVKGTMRSRHAQVLRSRLRALLHPATIRLSGDGLEVPSLPSLVGEECRPEGGPAFDSGVSPGPPCRLPVYWGQGDTTAGTPAVQFEGAIAAWLSTRPRVRVRVADDLLRFRIAEEPGEGESPDRALASGPWELPWPVRVLKTSTNRGGPWLEVAIPDRVDRVVNELIAAGARIAAISSEWVDRWCRLPDRLESNFWFAAPGDRHVLLGLVRHGVIVLLRQRWFVDADPVHCLRVLRAERDQALAADNEVPEKLLWLGRGQPELVPELVPGFVLIRLP